MVFLVQQYRQTDLIRVGSGRNDEKGCDIESNEETDQLSLPAINLIEKQTVLEKEGGKISTAYQVC